ncbi:MAG: hypothetical protein IPL32_03595 [Chloracidobacterium sp.]|nr:hypothetical protein [Chloracidobacterium sp.]
MAKITAGYVPTARQEKSEWVVRTQPDNPTKCPSFLENHPPSSFCPGFGQSVFVPVVTVQRAVCPVLAIKLAGEEHSTVADLSLDKRHYGSAANIS